MTGGVGDNLTSHGKCSKSGEQHRQIAALIYLVTFPLNCKIVLNARTSIQRSRLIPGLNKKRIDI
jgi:hypothetical protein